MTGVARASLLVLAGRLGGNLGFFVSALVFARALGPADRGAIAFFTTAAMVAAVVSSGGLREAGSVFFAREPENRPAVATNTVVFGMVLAVAAAVLVCGTLVAAPSLRPANLSTTQVLLLGVAILAAASLYLGYSLSIGLALFRQQAVIQPLYVWVYALALAFVWWGWGLTVTSAAVIWTCGQLLGGLLYTGVALRRVRPGRPDMGLFRRTLSFGVRAWIGSLSTFLNFRIDQVIMGAISTNSALGIYAVAVNASEIELYVPQSVSNGLLPIIAGTSQNERAERTLRVFRIVMLITLVGTAISFAAGPFLVPRVFGQAFHPSVTPFLWLVAGGVGYVAMSIFSAALVASDEPGWSSVGPFASLAVGVVLDFALIPGRGATGAAIAAAAAFFAGGITAAVAFARVHSLRWTSLMPGPGDLSDLTAVIRRGRG